MHDINWLALATPLAVGAIAWGLYCFFDKHMPR